MVTAVLEAAAVVVVVEAAAAAAVVVVFIGWLVDCLTSQPHASVSQ